MIRNEIYRVFCKNRFAVYILLFLIIKLISLIYYEPCINTDIEVVHDEYIEYISEFDGELTQTTIDNISQDYSLMISAGEEYTTLKSDYENGSINTEYFTQKSAELNNILKNKEVICLANETLEFVKENPGQRHIIYSNGWEAFIANEKLDYALIIAIILLVLFLFALDCEIGTYNLIATSKNGRTKLFYSKHAILITFIILINILLTLEEALFYSFKYGLSNFSAPVQSLISFRESPFNISILETVIIIMLFKIIGCIFLTEITILISNTLKRLWVTAALSGLIIFIPYAIFNNKTPRYYFQPLGLILSNGYIKGKCNFIFRNGLLISEPFEGISLKILNIMIIFVTAAAYIIFLISLKKQLLSTKKLLDKAFITSSICCFSALTMMIFFLNFSSKENNIKFNSVYSKGMGYSDEKYCYFNDDSLKAIDYSTKKEFNIIRDILKNKKADLYYVDNKYIYYMQKDINSGEVNFYSIDKNDFNEKLIYKEVKGIRLFNTDSKYLGLINTMNIQNVSSDYYEKEEIYEFWVDNKYIFTVDSNGINIIDTNHETSERIIEASIYPECLAYNKGTIYYADLMNNVYSYNINNKTSKKLNIENCKKLFFACNELVVVNFDYQVGVYRDSIHWLEDTTISPTSYVTSHKEGIVFVNHQNNPVFINLSNLSTQTISTGFKVFNVVGYKNTSDLYIYIQQDQDFEWRFLEIEK